jgi:hypothetical protein
MRCVSVVRGKPDDLNTRLKLLLQPGEDLGISFASNSDWPGTEWETYSGYATANQQLMGG